jgi:Flp pilus assembly pilin Flp
MAKVLSKLRSFATNDSGATSVEYALIAVVMTAGIVASVPAITAALNNALTSTATKLNTAVAAN